ncbi:MAG: M28 family peptidase [Salibacteraceae bacterium]
MAQNQAPVISNLAVVNNATQNQLVVTFDVSDAENDLLELQLSISDDFGQTYLVTSGTISGDQGFPMFQGNGKSIVWNYPSSVTSLQGYKVRIVADDRQPVDLAALLQQVDSNRMRQNLTFVQGIRHYSANPSQLEAVKDSLERLFLVNDWQADRQAFTFSNYNAHNILGRKPGLYEESKTYVLDGHFDGVNDSPGADDNGSAVVALMEAAIVLKDQHFGRSLRLIGFDFEESGLVGSQEYVANGIETWETIEGVINLEMIGYFDNAPNSHSLPTGFNLLFPDAYNAVANDNFRGNFIANVANTASNDLKDQFDSCANALVPNLRVISLAVSGTGTAVPDLRRSDHARFWDAGIPALMITDGANFRNPYYHSPADTLDLLDFGFMRQVTQAALATLVKLADIRHADVVSTWVEPLSTVGNAKLSAKSVKVFPNPSQSELFLGFPRVTTQIQTVVLFSLSGKLLWQQTLSPGRNNYQLDLSEMPSGAYEIVISDGESRENHTLIIQR